jgi:zinc and cadmium transporter
MLVPFAAGGFIYMAATDLMPELHKKPQPSASFIQLITIVSGVAFMAYLKIAIGA